MPPKTKITKKMIEKAAFGLALTDGIGAINSATISKKLGCSVAPIYSNFKNIEDLQRETLLMIARMIRDINTTRYTDISFMNLGIGRIILSVQFPQVFTDIVFRSLIPISKIEALATRTMSKAPAFRNLPQDDILSIFRRIYMVTTGICIDRLGTSGEQDEIIKQMVADVFDISLQIINSARGKNGLASVEIDFSVKNIPIKKHLEDYYEKYCN